jgi:hypothetical protein
VRDLDTIDSELRLITAVRRTIREHGGEPSSRQVDELLDERLAQLRGASEDVAVGTWPTGRGATFHPKNARLIHPCASHKQTENQTPVRLDASY